MKFKEYMKADNKKVFINPDEFAEKVEINGVKDINVVLDETPSFSRQE